MGRSMRPGAARAFLFCALIARPAAGAGLPAPLVNLSRHARVTLVGERHRTWDAPGLLLALARDALSEEGNVAVGLEIPADRQHLLDQAAAAGTTPDGLLPRVIDSPAYRAMLQGLAGLVREFPGRIQILALDAPERSRADRDGFMAGRVLEAVRGGADRVVVLVGKPARVHPPGKLPGRAAGAPRNSDRADPHPGPGGPGAYIPPLVCTGPRGNPLRPSKPLGLARPPAPQRPGAARTRPRDVGRVAGAPCRRQMSRSSLISISASLRSFFRYSWKCSVCFRGRRSARMRSRSAFRPSISGSVRLTRRTA